MSLQVWLPLNGNLNNQGCANLHLTTTVSPSYTNSGKIGSALSSGELRMSASDTASILNNYEFSLLLDICKRKCWTRWYANVIWK